MTEQLQHLIEVLQHLPLAAQDAIATRILEEIEEQDWDAIVSKPSVQTRLRELGRQALEEDWEDPVGAWSDLPDTMLEDLNRLCHAVPPRHFWNFYREFAQSVQTPPSPNYSFANLKASSANMRTPTPVAPFS